MSPWHAQADVIARYATEPESVDDAIASSLEQHLVQCVACRAALAGAVDEVDRATMAASWAAVVDAVDRPAPSATERVLRSLGVDDGPARLVASTTALRLAWVAAVAGAVAAAVLLSRAQSSDGPFLAIAPLVPMVAVLLSFTPLSDPAGEAGAAAPVSGVRLVLWRSVAVAVPAVVIVAVSSLLAPGATGATASWLLPGLALTATMVALSTSVRVSTSAASVAGLWCLMLLVMFGPTHHVALAGSVVFGHPGQAVALVATALSLAVVYRRRVRFATLEVRW